MFTIDLNSIKNAKANNQVFFYKNAFSNTLNWEDFYKLFLMAYMKKRIDFISFASMNIDRCDDLTEKFSPIIQELSKIHPGKYISVLSIIHMLSKDNIKIENEYYEKFYKNFVKVNPNKKIKIDNVKDPFIPTKHKDEVDGFFIQCEGQTKWTIYYEDLENTYILNKGDLIYVPCGILHSVLSMSPRASISISFSDNKGLK